jgi:hypothetical protein
MPRSIVHVSNRLTQHTGITMRELRFRRFVWVRYGGLVSSGYPGVARRLVKAEAERGRELTSAERGNLLVACLAAEGEVAT